MRSLIWAFAFHICVKDSFWREAAQFILLFIFSQWAKEPDNVAGVENCAVIRANGKFSDRDCNAQQNFLCKKSQDYSTFSVFLVLHVSIKIEVKTP